MTMDQDYLFLYGTLRKLLNKPMLHFIEKHSTFVGIGTVQGRLYNILTYPGMLPSDDPADQVFGEVYELHHPGKIFAQLDPYERCGPDDPQPHEYRRSQTEATLTDDSTVRVWVYWYNHNILEENRIDSGDYLKFLAERA